MFIIRRHVAETEAATVRPDARPRRIRFASLLVALLTMGFAGCLGETPDDTRKELAPDPPLTETERLLGAVRAGMPATSPADNDDWFLLSAPRAPDGFIRTFHWRLPPGAVQEPGEIPIATMLMEIVPVQDAFAPGEDWALLAFHDDDGVARLVFALLGPTVTEENLTTEPPTQTQRPPPTGGGVLFYGGESLEPDDDLYFILIAHGQAGETAFALRTTVGDPQSPPPAAANFDAFVADEPDPPRVPTPLWDGAGDYTAFYGERIVYGDDRRRVWTDTIDQEAERYDPESGAGRAARVAVASVAETGGPAWSLAYAAHLAFAETVWWSIDIETQGVARQANGVTGNDPFGATGALLARANGMPKALFMADGDGASHVRFTVEGARGSLGEGTTVQHHRLPATMEEMIGIPSMTVDDLYQGDAGGLPWLGPLPSG